MSVSLAGRFGSVFDLTGLSDWFVKIYKIGAFDS
jgi:hypothetical protein